MKANNLPSKFTAKIISPIPSKTNINFRFINENKTRYLFMSNVTQGDLSVGKIITHTMQDKITQGEITLCKIIQ